MGKTQTRKKTYKRTSVNNDWASSSNANLGTEATTTSPPITGAAGGEEASTTNTKTNTSSSKIPAFPSKSNSFDEVDVRQNIFSKSSSNNNDKKDLFNLADGFSRRSKNNIKDKMCIAPVSANDIYSDGEVAATRGDSLGFSQQQKQRNSRRVMLRETRKQIIESNNATAASGSLAPLVTATNVSSSSADNNEVFGLEQGHHHERHDQLPKYTRRREYNIDDSSSPDSKTEAAEEPDGGVDSIVSFGIGGGPKFVMNPPPLLAGSKGKRVSSCSLEDTDSDEGSMLSSVSKAQSTLDLVDNILNSAAPIGRRGSVSSTISYGSLDRRGSASSTISYGRGGNVESSSGRSYLNRSRPATETTEADATDGSKDGNDGRGSPGNIFNGLENVVAASSHEMNDDLPDNKAEGGSSADATDDDGSGSKVSFLNSRKHDAITYRLSMDNQSCMTAKTHATEDTGTSTGTSKTSNVHKSKNQQDPVSPRTKYNSPNSSNKHGGGLGAHFFSTTQKSKLEEREVLGALEKKKKKDKASYDDKDSTSTGSSVSTTMSSLGGATTFTMATIDQHTVNKPITRVQSLKTRTAASAASGSSSSNIDEGSNDDSFLKPTLQPLPISDDEDTRTDHSGSSNNNSKIDEGSDDDSSLNPKLQPLPSDSIHEDIEEGSDGEDTRTTGSSSSNIINKINEGSDDDSFLNPKLQPLPSDSIHGYIEEENNDDPCMSSSRHSRKANKVVVSLVPDDNAQTTQNIVSQPLATRDNTNKGDESTDNSNNVLDTVASLAAGSDTNPHATGNSALSNDIRRKLSTIVSMDYDNVDYDDDQEDDEHDIFNSNDDNDDDDAGTFAHASAPLMLEPGAIDAIASAAAVKNDAESLTSSQQTRDEQQLQQQLQKIDDGSPQSKEMAETTFQEAVAEVESLLSHSSKFSSRRERKLQLELEQKQKQELDMSKKSSDSIYSNPPNLSQNSSSSNSSTKEADKKNADSYASPQDDESNKSSQGTQSDYDTQSSEGTQNTPGNEGISKDKDTSSINNSSIHNSIHGGSMSGKATNIEKHVQHLDPATSFRMKRFSVGDFSYATGTNMNDDDASEQQSIQTAKSDIQATLLKANELLSQRQLSDIAQSDQEYGDGDGDGDDNNVPQLDKEFDDDDEYEYEQTLEQAHQHQPILRRRSSDISEEESHINDEHTLLELDKEFDDDDEHAYEQTLEKAQEQQRQFFLRRRSSDDDIQEEISNNQQSESESKDIINAFEEEDDTQEEIKNQEKISTDFRRKAYDKYGSFDSESLLNISQRESTMSAVSRQGRTTNAISRRGSTIYNPAADFDDDAADFNIDVNKHTGDNSKASSSGTGSHASSHSGSHSSPHSSSDPGSDSNGNNSNQSSSNNSKHRKEQLSQTSFKRSRYSRRFSDDSQGSFLQQERPKLSPSIDDESFGEVPDAAKVSSSFNHNVDIVRRNSARRHAERAASVILDNLVLDYDMEDEIDYSANNKGRNENSNCGSSASSSNWGCEEDLENIDEEEMGAMEGMSSENNRGGYGGGNNGGRHNNANNNSNNAAGQNNNTRRNNHNNQRGGASGNGGQDGGYGGGGGDDRNGNDNGRHDYSGSDSYEETTDSEQDEDDDSSNDDDMKFPWNNKLAAEAVNAAEKWETGVDGFIDVDNSRQTNRRASSAAFYSDVDVIKEEDDEDQDEDISNNNHQTAAPQPIYMNNKLSLIAPIPVSEPVPPFSQKEEQQQRTDQSAGNIFSPPNTQSQERPQQPKQKENVIATKTGTSSSPTPTKPNEKKEPVRRMSLSSVVSSFNQKSSVHERRLSVASAANMRRMSMNSMGPRRGSVASSAGNRRMSTASANAASYRRGSVTSTSGLRRSSIMSASQARWEARRLSMMSPPKTDNMDVNATSNTTTTNDTNNNTNTSANGNTSDSDGNSGGGLNQFMEKTQQQQLQVQKRTDRRERRMSLNKPWADHEAFAYTNNDDETIEGVRQRNIATITSGASGVPAVAASLAQNISNEYSGNISSHSSSSDDDSGDVDEDDEDLNDEDTCVTTASKTVTSSTHSKDTSKSYTNAEDDCDGDDEDGVGIYTDKQKACIERRMTPITSNIPWKSNSPPRPVNTSTSRRGSIIKNISDNTTSTATNHSQQQQFTPSFKPFSQITKSSTQSYKPFAENNTNGNENTSSTVVSVKPFTHSHDSNASNSANMHARSNRYYHNPKTSTVESDMYNSSNEYYYNPNNTNDKEHAKTNAKNNAKSTPIPNGKSTGEGQFINPAWRNSNVTNTGANTNTNAVNQHQQYLQQQLQQPSNVEETDDRTAYTDEHTVDTSKHTESAGNQTENTDDKSYDDGEFTDDEYYSKMISLTIAKMGGRGPGVKPKSAPSQAALPPHPSQVLASATKPLDLNPAAAAFVAKRVKEKESSSSTKKESKVKGKDKQRASLANTIKHFNETNTDDFRDDGTLDTTKNDKYESSDSDDDERTMTADPNIAASKPINNTTKGNTVTSTKTETTPHRRSTFKKSNNKKKEKAANAAMYRAAKAVTTAITAEEKPIDYVKTENERQAKARDETKRMNELYAYSAWGKAAMVVERRGSSKAVGKQSFVDPNESLAALVASTGGTGGGRGKRGSGVSTVVGSTDGSSPIGKRGSGVSTVSTSANGAVAIGSSSNGTSVAINSAGTNTGINSKAGIMNAQNEGQTGQQEAKKYSNDMSNNDSDRKLLNNKNDQTHVVSQMANDTSNISTYDKSGNETAIYKEQFEKEQGIKMHNDNQGISALPGTTNIISEVGTFTGNADAVAGSSISNFSNTSKKQKGNLESYGKVVKENKVAHQPQDLRREREQVQDSFKQEQHQGNFDLTREQSYRKESEALSTNNDHVNIANSNQNNVMNLEKTNQHMRIDNDVNIVNNSNEENRYKKSYDEPTNHDFNQEIDPLDQPHRSLFLSKTSNKNGFTYAEISTNDEDEDDTNKNFHNYYQDQQPIANSLFQDISELCMIFKKEVLITFFLLVAVAAIVTYLVETTSNPWFPYHDIDRDSNTNSKGGTKFSPLEPTTGSDRWSQFGSVIVGMYPSDQTGFSVSSNYDGKKLVIGARHSSTNGEKSGSVLLYEYYSTDSSWKNVGIQRGKTAGDQFGYSVSMSSDGKRFAAAGIGHGSSSDRTGQVVVYEVTAPGYPLVQLGNEIYGDQPLALFGMSISLSKHGNRLAVGAPYYDNLEKAKKNIGFVMLLEYTETSNDWEKLVPGFEGRESQNLFGRAVALSSDGNVLAVGAPNNLDVGYVQIYMSTPTSSIRKQPWLSLGSIITGHTLNDQFGNSISIAENGQVVAVGAPGSDWNGSNSGYVCVYAFNSEKLSWLQRGDCMNGWNAEDRTGFSVSLSSDGSRLSVGSPGSDEIKLNGGSVVIYEFDGLVWNSIHVIEGDNLNGNAGFSSFLSGDGDTVAVGMPKHDCIGACEGSVGIYSRNDSK